MVKNAIISKHIVLTSLTQYKAQHPQYGIILIEDELISDVVIIDQNVPVKAIAEKYSDWNPVDYSDYYVSPGLIDLNARREWSNYSQFTKAAIKGGTTLILEEESFFCGNQKEGKLYCDVAEAVSLNELNADNLECLEASGALALKSYCYPPSGNVQALNSKLAFAIRNAKLPLLINPTTPNPRMLYMASPHRLDHFSNRLEEKTQPGLDVFAAAFPEDINSDEEEEFCSPISRLRSESVSYYKNASSPKLDYLRSISEEEVTFEALPKTKTIFDDLDKRIKANQQSIQSLSLAEQKTYQTSGKTVYNVSKKSDRRPQPISIPKVERDNEKTYIYHLANNPDYWEVSGVKQVLEITDRESKVHFFGISSAAAINLIRQSKKDKPNLSCEIPAAHLYFTSDSVGDGDTRFKSNPPIRNKGNFNLVWDLLKMKGIDVVSSNHCFIDSEYKCRDFQKALGGLNTMGCTLQAIWSVLNIPFTTQNQLEHYIVRLAKWLSLQPAKILGLSDRGSIEKSKLADLIVWSPYEKLEFECCDSNIFSGLQMYGEIKKVYLRGHTVYEKGNCFSFGKRVLKN